MLDFRTCTGVDRSRARLVIGRQLTEAVTGKRDLPQKVRDNSNSQGLTVDLLSGRTSLPRQSRARKDQHKRCRTVPVQCLHHRYHSKTTDSFPARVEYACCNSLAVEYENSRMLTSADAK